MAETTQDYEKLKSDYINLKQELEDKNQELYKCKRNVEVLERLQTDYKNEVDMLQSGEIRQKQKYQDIIKQLEQQIYNIRESHNDEKQALENVIMKMEEKNEYLRREVGIYKETGGNTTNFVGDTSSLINDILSDPPEFYENEQLKSTLKELQETNEALNKQVEEYATEIENLKESYNLTRKDLQEANSNNQFLNDEIMCLKMEIDALKNQPLNKDSRGNSLFAEVDDRRVYLQEKINKMKANYVRMSQEKAHLQNTVRQLQLENIRLSQKWKLDVEEKDDDEHEVQVALRFRLKTLEDLIEQYKRDLEAKPLVISDRSFEEIEFYNAMLRDKNKQIQELRDDRSATSLERLLLAKGMRKANEEKRKWHLEAINKQHQLELIQIEKSLNSIAKSENENPSCSSASKDGGRTENNKHPSNILRDSTNKTEEKKDANDYEESRQENITVTRGSNSCGSSICKQRLSDIKEEGGGPDCLKDTSRVVKENIGEIPAEKSTINPDTTCVDKENIDENPAEVSNINPTQKVTFAENTISPKKTNRRGGRRVFVPKPIIFMD